MRTEKDDRVAFIDAIIKVYEQFGMTLGHEDSQGSFLIQDYKEYNIKWLKESIDYYI